MMGWNQTVSSSIREALKGEDFEGFHTPEYFAKAHTDVHVGYHSEFHAYYSRNHRKFVWFYTGLPDAPAYVDIEALPSGTRADLVNALHGWIRDCESLEGRFLGSPDDLKEKITKHRHGLEDEAVDKKETSVPLAEGWL